MLLRGDKYDNISLYFPLFFIYFFTYLFSIYTAISIFNHNLHPPRDAVLMATKVLRVPELLENILANLSMRNLLHAQRVSRHWNHVITYSPTLQQNLFFQPARTCPQPQENLTVDINPLLQELFPPFISDLFTLDYGNVDDEEDNICLLQSRPGYEGSVDILRDQEWYKSETKRQAVLRSDSSWRRMFPSHPPPRLGTFDVDMIGCGCESDWMAAELSPEYKALNQNEGLRMGLLWDAVVFVLDDFPQGQFSIVWWRRRDGDTNDKDYKNNWVLELFAETRPAWDCFMADESYGPSGLKVVDHDNLIEYNRGDPEKPIIEAVAVPLSALEGIQNEE